MKRRCTKCGRKKNEDDFQWRDKKKGRRQSWCRICMKDRSKEYFQENKEAFAERNRSIRAKHRAEIAKYKESVPCGDCGKKYRHYVMDFDHVVGHKNGNVADMINSCVSWEKIKEEIAKCEVVCANCHRERTHKGL